MRPKNCTLSDADTPPVKRSAASNQPEHSVPRRQAGQSEPHMVRSHPRTPRMWPTCGILSSTLHRSVVSVTSPESLLYAAGFVGGPPHALGSAQHPVEAHLRQVQTMERWRDEVLEFKTPSEFKHAAGGLFASRPVEVVGWSGADNQFREIQPVVAKSVPACRQDGQFSLHPSVAL